MTESSAWLMARCLALGRASISCSCCDLGLRPAFGGGELGRGRRADQTIDADADADAEVFGQFRQGQKPRSLRSAAMRWRRGFDSRDRGSYAPNALGQPTAVTAQAPNAQGQLVAAIGFASGASYYPNGALKQFTFGNSIVRDVTQNTRGLTSRVRDTYGATVYHDFGYVFDANGN
jgi:hypothetical protein